MRRPENERHHKRKLLHCETESVPARKAAWHRIGIFKSRLVPKAVGLSVDSLLHCNKGNGNGGNSVRKGESFTPPSSGFNYPKYRSQLFLVPVAGAARRYIIFVILHNAVSYLLNIHAAQRKKTQAFSEHFFH